MPIKSHTRHEKPSKKTTVSGLFVQRGETGEKPNKGVMDYALKVASQQKNVGGKKTLVR